MIHELPVRSLYMVHDLHVGSWYMSNMVVHDARVTLWFMIQEIPYGSWYMITCTCWFMMHELPHGSWCMSYLMVHDAQVTCGSWSISYWVVHDTWVTKWFMIHELPSGSWCSCDGLKTQYRTELYRIFLHPLVHELPGGSWWPVDTWYRHERRPEPPPCWVWTSWYDVGTLSCWNASVSAPDFWLDRLNWYSSLCLIAAPFCKIIIIMMTYDTIFPIDKYKDASFS